MSKRSYIVACAIAFMGVSSRFCYSGDRLSMDEAAFVTQTSGKYGTASEMRSNQEVELQNDHQKFDNSVFLEADFIYWNVGQEGNNYAASGTTNNARLFPVVHQGQIYRPHSKMSPGFKVALGVNLDKDLWDVALRYTWLRSHGRGTTPQFDIADLGNSAEDFPLTPLFNDLNSLALTEGYIHVATADSIIHFNSLDSELGKNLYISAPFYLRMYVGLKGVWSKESLSVNYSINALGTNLPRGTNIIHYTQNYWGLGPRIGAYGLWSLWKKHIELFAETAFSALWSGVDLKTTTYDTIFAGLLGNSYSNVVTANQRYRMHTLIPAFELSLGLQTEWIFKNGSRLLAAAGWETQMFLFMVQHSSTIADLNLNMEGLTLKFRYDF